MKLIQYYKLILLMLFVASCTTDDFAYNEDAHLRGNKIQLIARNTPFTEYEVVSRAADNSSKPVYDFIIFGNDNTCVYYNHCEDDIINIDRATDFSSISQDNLSSCDMYILVNYPSIYDKILAEAATANETDVVKYIRENIIGKTLDYFDDTPTPVIPVVNMSENLLPRIGRYSEKVDLRTSASIASGTIYPVYLQSLYAKMQFDVEVKPTEENPNLPTSNTFQITGYTVHNLAKEVDLWSGTEGQTHDDINVYSQAVEGVLGDDVPRTPVTNLSFTCYLPERFFKSVKDTLTFKYPFGIGENIRKEDKARRQRYKPLLAKGYDGFDSEYDESKDKKATYLTLSGVFTNHQGHTYDVSYDIYVGNDNCSNFDIVRNRHYINTITIKGIHNSSDQSADEGSVSIDHRVNVKRTLPVILSLRRELLLDAHYEVRPLRIRKKVPHDGTETHVKVEVIYDANDKPDAAGNGNWIGLERSFGNGVAVQTSDLYCVGNGSSAGKRKYFTYDLVDKRLSKGTNTDTQNPLHTSISLVVPIPSSVDKTECVWIYVDECTEASSSKDAKRSATIRVTCGKADANGQNFTPMDEPIDYVINQHKLFQVSWKNRKYWIEHEEEYLHNFDSEDTFEHNQTEEEGMEWGLYNAQLSFDNEAFVYDSGDGWLADIVDWIIDEYALGNISVYYDFYIPKHDKISNVEKFAYSGWDFCKNIIKDINTKDDNNRNTGYAGRIEALTMDKLSMYAIEYAYNRNKRNRNGSIPEDYNKWYLPAIDEMEDIMMGGASYFDEFRNKFYWSSQPSYLVNYVKVSGAGSGEGSYYSDDTGIYYIEENKTTTMNNGYSRATKANYLGDDGNSETIDWEYAPSGTSGYDDAIKVSSYIIYNKATMQRSGKVGNVELNSIDRDDDPKTEGNHTRDTKHRVRCVYKSPYYEENKESTDY